ncbi:MAG: DUF86 domain-containing protein [Nanoarchaeota archaeon]
MEKNILIFLEHILNSIRDSEKSIKNKSRREFDKNKDMQDASIRRIEIIGEAAKNIPDSIRKKYSNIPWKEIIGTRDKMIHHYFGVDLDIVWEIIKNDFPQLKKQVLKIKKEIKNQNA